MRTIVSRQTSKGLLLVTIEGAVLSATLAGADPQCRRCARPLSVAAAVREPHPAEARAAARYRAAFGEPPTLAAWSPSTTAAFDAADAIGCDCNEARAFVCHAALATADGRCGCGCHPDERALVHPEVR